MMIIPLCRGMNQSQCVDNPIIGRIAITQETRIFFRGAGTLVPIMSTKTWWFDG
jgi:hypothetical protein